MDKVELERFIIKHIIEYLQNGNYVSFCNKYMGSYYDGEVSDDRYKIDKKNIKFVNGDRINTIYGQHLNLYPIGIKMEVDGVEQIFKRYIIIDVNDWSIYYYIKEWWYYV